MKEHISGDIQECRTDWDLAPGHLPPTHRCSQLCVELNLIETASCPYLARRLKSTTTGFSPLHFLHLHFRKNLTSNLSHLNWQEERLDRLIRIIMRTGCSRKIHSPWQGDKVNSYRLSYRPDRLNSCLASMTTLCLSQLYFLFRGLWIWLRCIWR